MPENPKVDVPEAPVERAMKFWSWLDEEIAYLESIDLTPRGESSLSSLRKAKEMAEFYGASSAGAALYAQERERVEAERPTPHDAVEVLAGEQMIFRFGGKLIDGAYLIKWKSEIYRWEDAPADLRHHWEQARENARRTLREDRIGLDTIRDQAAQQERDRIREALLGKKAVTAVRLLYADKGINKPPGAVRGDLEAALATLDQETDQ